MRLGLLPEIESQYPFHEYCQEMRFYGILQSADAWAVGEAEMKRLDQEEEEEYQATMDIESFWYLNVY